MDTTKAEKEKATKNTFVPRSYDFYWKTMTEKFKSQKSYNLNQLLMFADSFNERETNSLRQENANLKKVLKDMTDRMNTTRIVSEGELKKIDLKQARLWKKVFSKIWEEAQRLLEQRTPKK